MFGKGKGDGGAVSITKGAEAAVVPADERAPDDLGRFPAEVDGSPSRARTTDKALRAVSIVAIVSAMMNIALIMLIITLFPLQKVYPFLVTFKNQDNQVVKIEPMEVGAVGMDYATEDAVRDYVTQRHSYVPVESAMIAQWGPASRLAARTESTIYQKFLEASKTESERMMAAGYKREVSINSVQRIARDTWQVSFVTMDVPQTSMGTLLPPNLTRSSGTAAPSTSVPDVNAGGGFGAGNIAAPAPEMEVQGERKNWVATMKVTYLPRSVNYGQRLLNPLGFTVTDYSVTRDVRN